MTETLHLNVTGMTCGGCENAVTRAVGQLDGVQRVVASHKDASVDVTFESGKVTRAAIEGKIEKLGYKVARSA
jgi:copper chaperone